MLYWLHPIWQGATAVLALYVLYLGWRRFMMRHWGGKGGFPWKRHVRLGQITLAAWCVGAMIGATAARMEWGVSFLTGIHAWIGILFVILAAFGAVSGRSLDRNRQKRFWLPVLHGAGNLLLVILAFVQLWTGWAYLP